MFRHKGKGRTYIHNLRLASVLSFVAGIVNVTGVLSVKVLTTNVTGHFAYFTEEISRHNYGTAFVYLLFMLSFLSGAFSSNLLIELVSRRKPAFAYSVPMTLEILLLTTVGLWASHSNAINGSAQIIVCVLLFAMGLQNSLVTNASQSVVRTTHLTGLFTDLGIELSQLFFYRRTLQFQQLTKSIYLKLTIIGCFFSGCIIGGFAFGYLEFTTLLLAVLCLVVALFYDNIRFHYYHFKRKIH